MSVTQGTGKIAVDPTKGVGQRDPSPKAVSFMFNADGIGVGEDAAFRKSDDGGRHGLPHEPLDAAATRGQCQRCLFSQHSPNESEASA
jgi:hypothetical protein